MTDLSPQAQAIVDAYDSAPFVDYDIGDRVSIAAALRALTEYSVMFYDPDEYADAVRVSDILKIADELEQL